MLCISHTNNSHHAHGNDVTPVEKKAKLCTLKKKGR